MSSTAWGALILAVPARTQRQGLLRVALCVGLASRQPHEARDVVIVVLHPLAHHCGAVDVRCQPRSQRRLSPHSRGRHHAYRLRRRSRWQHSRVGELPPQQACALPRHLGMGDHRIDLAQRYPLRGDQRVLHRQQHLPHDLQVSMLVREQIQRHRHRPIERVLDRRHRPLHFPPAHRNHRVVDRRERNWLDGVRRRA